MTRIKTKLSHIAIRNKVQDEIIQLGKDLPWEYRHLAQQTSDILMQLRPLERHRAWDLIRQRHQRGELDCHWLANFLVVLERLKGEEDAKQ